MKKDFKICQKQHKKNKNIKKDKTVYSLFVDVLIMRLFGHGNSAILDQRCFSLINLRKVEIWDQFWDNGSTAVLIFFDGLE